MIVGLQQCFELIEMLGLKLQGIVPIEAINKFLLAVNLSEVLKTLRLKNRHGGVGTRRHLKVRVLESRAESVNAARVERFASNPMKVDVLGLLKPNDRFFLAATPFHHQSLIGPN